MRRRLKARAGGRSTEAIEQAIADRSAGCEFCGSDPCHCDRDDTNPVDVSDEKWTEIYSRPDYDADHDHSMDY